MTMTETANADFTPHEAAAALTRLANYEETLTARAFGVTLIAFGIAGAATSLTYAYASDWFVDAGIAWALSFLWLPFIFSAGLLTAIVWQTHSITLQRRDHDKKAGSWWLFIGFSVLYMGIMGALYLIDDRTALDLGDANRGLLTLGLFTTLITAFFQRMFGYSWMLRSMYIASVLLVGAAFGYAALDLASVPSALLAAGTGAAVWVTTGAYVAYQG